MSHLKLRAPRRMSVESLEGRSLMAGVVAVNVTAGGDLVITGDGEANEIRVIQSLQNGVPIAGRYFISGQNGTTVTGTVNGFANGFVSDDIIINLAGNNDRLTVGDGVNNGRFIVPDDLVINMGDGNNVVTVDRITVRDDASITTGAGSDSVTVRASVGAQPNVDLGANDLSIVTGNRNDNVRVENTFVRRDLRIDAGGTDNFADVVDLLLGSIGNDTTIFTGAGGDTVRISDMGFNDDLTIDAGADIDAVTISRSQFDELIALLGSGNGDTLNMFDNTGRRATLSGGDGSGDTLTSRNNRFSQISPAPVGFEVFNFL